MKRSGGRKSKSAPGQDKTLPSPPKASSSPSKSSSSPAKASAGARSRKRPVRRGPDDTTGDSTSDRPPENVTDQPASHDDSRASSPDPNCSICLCKMEDKSFTHSCFHMFCFTCLLEWSKIKAECPLCKQSFTSIIHNIRSESDYDVHYLRDTTAATPPSLPTPDDVQVFPFLFGRSPLRPWTPLLSPIDLQLLADLRSTAHGVTRGFYSDEAFHIFQHMEGRNQIYRDERWAREITLPPGLTYRNVSPEYFTASAGSEYFQRIATWLDRELATLSRHNINMRSHVRDYILHLLQRFDVRSVNFYAQVEFFFGSQTRLFVNQLHNFVRSPLTIRETDHHTVYSDRPPTPPESEVITLDRDDSDIEIVSPAVTNLPPRRRMGDLSDSLFGSPSRPLEIVGSDVALRLNSPIAGPSGLLPRNQTSVIPDRDMLWDHGVTDLHEVSDSESTSTVSHCDNEIVVVGFDKPWRARSPISLSSDGSDIEVDEGCTETSAGSSRKSLESEVRPQEGPEVDIKRAADVEGDAGSRPWSEFSPDALSEISSRGSFDKSLDCFLRSNHSPFVGFERRFLPNPGLEAFCSHDRPGVCELGKEEEAVVIGSDVPPTENLFLPKRRKRNRDDCGDSGVVVDVEQFGELSEEPPPKKATYKKHCRGHKKSINRPEESSLESDGNLTNARSEEQPIVGPCQEEDGSLAVQEPELSSDANGLSHEVLEGAVSSVLETESSKEVLLHRKFAPDTTDEEPMDEETTYKEHVSFEQNDTSSISTCDNSTDRDTKSSAESSQRSLKPPEKGLGTSDESTTCSATQSDSSEPSRIRDNLDLSLHSVESIDSDDSVQWLDSENPTLSVQLRKRHISIGSNESLVSSVSGGSVILQLSDEEDEEDDSRHVEGVSSDLCGGTSRHSSPQSLSLADFEAARDYSGRSVDDMTRFNGIKRLSEFLEDISDDFDFAASDDTIVGLLQLSGNELGVAEELGNCVECLPESSQAALERDSGDDDVLKSENVSNKVRCDEKTVNSVECLSECSETTHDCVFGENEILEAANAANVMPSVETVVDGVRRLSESSENTLECEFSGDDILESGNVTNTIEIAVNGVGRLSESSENMLECEFDGNEILESGNVAHSKKTAVNGVKCLSENTSIECDFKESGILESGNVAPSVETAVNSGERFSDEVDYPGVQSRPFTLYVDTYGIQTRTSGSFGVEDACDRAITEATLLINEKLKNNGSLAVDKSY